MALRLIFSNPCDSSKCLEWDSYPVTLSRTAVELCVKSKFGSSALLVLD